MIVFFGISNENVFKVIYPIFIMYVSLSVFSWRISGCDIHSFFIYIAIYFLAYEWVCCVYLSMYFFHFRDKSEKILKRKNIFICKSFSLKVDMTLME